MLRQNLYGDALGWGEGVLVADRQPGRDPSLWCCPARGPRRRPRRWLARANTSAATNRAAGQRTIPDWILHYDRGR